MKDGGGVEAGGKVKGTSSAHCWGLENGCGADGKGRKKKKPTSTWRAIANSIFVGCHSNQNKGHPKSVK